MNILIITQEDFLAGSTYSVSYLAIGLANKGHRVFVGARPESLLHTLIRNTAATFVPLTLHSRFSLASIREVAGLIKRENIQVVNAQSSKDRYVAIFARWLHNLKVSVIHTRRQYPQSIGGWLQRQLYVKGTDKIVVISEELKRIFINKGFPAGHLHVIHNGIPPEKYAKWSESRVKELAHQLGISKSDVVIGCVSRLKRQEQIIRCLPHLNNPGAKVLFVGLADGYFNSLVSELNIRNPILYVDTASGEEVLNYYRLFSVSILPSITDGFGLVLLEAMAMRCPVIATNFGGIKDVVQEGWNGLLFEDENVQQLARCIQRMLTDESLRQTVIRNGLDTALNRFSMENTLTRYERFFEQLVDERNAFTRKG